jgi:hypothetical protein
MSSKYLNGEEEMNYHIIPNNAYRYSSLPPVGGVCFLPHPLLESWLNLVSDF